MTAANPQELGKAVVTGRLVSNLFKAKDDPNNPGEKKYTATIVLDDDQVGKLDGAIAEVVKDSFPKGKLPRNARNWAERTGDDVEMPSFEKRYVNVSSKKPFATFVKRNGKTEETTEDEGVIYAGCDVVASLRVYAITHGDNPCVSVGANAVMFRRDNDRMGGSVDADAEFADFDSELAEDTSDDWLG